MKKCIIIILIILVSISLNLKAIELEPIDEIDTDSIMDSTGSLIFFESIAISPDGQYVYALVGKRGMYIFRWDTDTTYNLMGSYSIASKTQKIVTKDNYAFIAHGDFMIHNTENYHAGLLVIDISQPEKPQLIMEYSLDYRPGAIFIQDNYLFLGNGYSSMLVFDITNPQDIEIVAKVPTAGFVEEICMNDSLVYLLCDGAGLQIYNTIDIHNPHFIGSYTCGWKTMDIKNNFAFITSQNGELIVLDLANLLHIFHISTFLFEKKPDRFYRPLFSDIILYDDNTLLGLPGSNDGLIVIDITDPQNPTFISQLGEVGGSSNLTIKDDFLYVYSLSAISRFKIVNSGQE
jgi:hypothetical protein